MTPLLEIIMQELADRISLIDGTGDYYTAIGQNVYRGRTELNSAELPAATLRLTPRTPAESLPHRTITESSVIIHGRVEDYRRTMEQVGIELLADIQRAVESDDRTLNGLISSDMGWIRDEIYYPDPAQPVIAVDVEYSIPHLRKWGDPT